MRTILIVALSFLCLMACTTTNKKESKEEYLSIQGNWHTQHKNYFCFTNELAVYEKQAVPYCPFKIKDSILYINEGAWWYKYKWEKEPQSYVFKITFFEEDEIHLVPDIWTKNLLFANDTIDTLLLTRLKPQSNSIFERISFYAKGCHGFCPRVFVEVHKDGTFLLFAQEFMPFEGLYRGQLDSNVMNYLQRQINQVPLDKQMKAYNETYLTHGDYRGLELKTTDTTYLTTGQEMPVELHLLLSQIKYLFLQVDVEADSTIVEDIQNIDFYKTLLPAPPPPRPPGL